MLFVATRRFGKSLFVDTLKEIFEGMKLFEDSIL
nr:AAA family ATPase [Cylindrospermopsis raciborskii]